MPEQEYFDDYLKYISQQRAILIKERLERIRENPYHDMYI
jgi:hypothetical protein